MKVLVPLAEGFEEIEAIVPINIWRRAGWQVTSAGLQEGVITATRKTRHVADALLSDILIQHFDIIYLPGGRPGADHLLAHLELGKKLIEQQSKDGWIVAICAAPLVLDGLGLLQGKRFTAHPSAHAELKSIPLKERIVVDGKLITGVSAGASADLALKTLEEVAGKELVEQVQAGLNPQSLS